MLRQASLTLFSSCLKTATSVGAGTTLLARLVLLQCTSRMLLESEELSWKHQQVADEMGRKIKATQTLCDPTARAAQQAIVRLGVSAPCSASPTHIVTSKIVSVCAWSSEQPGFRTVSPAWGHPAAAPVPAASWTRLGRGAESPLPRDGGTAAGALGSKCKRGPVRRRVGRWASSGECRVYASALLAKSELVLL